MSSATRTASRSAREGFIRRAFVTAQVAGATTLLVCMVIAAQGFRRTERIDPGFTTDHTLTLQLSLPPARYKNAETIGALHNALRERFTAIGGIQAVGAVSLLPLSGLLSAMDVVFPDRPAPPPDEVPQAQFRIAGPGYFAAAGINVIDGREFSERDGSQASPAAIVSLAFAERHWPRERVVGRYVQFDAGAPAPPLEIIGVVQDVKQFTMDAAATEDLYVPLLQIPASQAAAVAARMSWVIRTNRDPARSVSEVRQVVRRVDPDIATSNLRTLEEVVARSLASQRATVQLLEALSQAALALAVIGVYAIAAFSASARKRELAIRSALGASEGQLMRLVLAAEMRPVLIGVTSGWAVAKLTTHWIGGNLFPIGSSDQVVYFAVGVLLTMLALGAISIPASRAARSHPLELLQA